MPVRNVRKQVRRLEPELSPDLHVDRILGTPPGWRHPKTLLRVPAFGCELEAVKLEGGRDRAAYERPLAQRARGLPLVRRNDDLRALSCGKVLAEHAMPGLLAFDACG